MSTLCEETLYLTYHGQICQNHAREHHDSLYKDFSMVYRTVLPVCQTSVTEGECCKCVTYPALDIFFFALIQNHRLRMSLLSHCAAGEAELHIPQLCRHSEVHRTIER